MKHLYLRWLQVYTTLLLLVVGCNMVQIQETSEPPEEASSSSQSKTLMPTKRQIVTPPPLASMTPTYSTEPFTELVIQTYDGQPLDGEIWDVQLSDDGRRFVFISTATNLIHLPTPEVPSDREPDDASIPVFENNSTLGQVYVHDREQDTTLLISASSDGSPGNGSSYAPSIAGDGQMIAFFSYASNLSAEANRDCSPIDPVIGCGTLYLFNILSGELVHIPVNAVWPVGLDTALSDEGRYVTFSAGQASTYQGIYRYDRITREMMTIVGGDGFDDNESLGEFRLDMSSDGQVITFVSSLDRLVSDDSNGVFDVFVYDHKIGEIVRISRSVDNSEAEGADEQPSGVQSVPATGGAVEIGLDISANGRYVVFQSGAGHLVNQELPACEHRHWPDPLPHCRHIYLYDRDSGLTHLISLSSEEMVGNFASEGGSVSNDGRFVIFTSRATNFVNGIVCPDQEEGLCSQVYVRDRARRQTYLVSRPSMDTLPDGPSRGGFITPDGRYIGFLLRGEQTKPEVLYQNLFIAELFKLLNDE